MDTDYRALIASNKYSQAFKIAYGRTPGNAIGSLKRKCKDWKDCFIWIERKQDNGEFARD
jgi:hypothetical protein